MVTLEIELAQGAFEMVHLKTLLPTPNPVIVVAGLVGVLIVPLPESNVHTPVPTIGVLAAMIAPAVTQTVWFGPADEIDGTAFVVMVMLAVDEVHGGLLIDQVSTVVPTVSPVTVVLATSEFVMVPGPETFIQLPTPAPGTFPAKVTEPVVTQIVWLGPALAIEGAATPVMVTLEIELAQGAFEIVHLKTLLPTPNPVIVVAGLVGVVIVPLPESNVHAPVPAVGVFAAIVAPPVTQTV
mgnify:CR=1 FL=1